MQIRLLVLPSLIAAALIPLAGLATFLIERGSRRGRGLAGFLVLMGAADACATVMRSAPVDGPPPHRAVRMLIAFAFLAFVALVDFFGDLAERSGSARILGLARRPTEWILRAIAATMAAGMFVPGLLLRGAARGAWAGWEPAWGPAWPLVALSSAFYITWGLACWNAERRRRGRLERDLTVWLIAFLLLTVAPGLIATTLPPLGVHGAGALVPISSILGAFATFAGLLLSRDLELHRLRKAPAIGSVRTTSPTPSVRPSGSSTTGPLVICCESCGATYQALPSSGVCPLDGGAVRTSNDPLVGSLVDGRYRILQFLGHGGMARVYAAEHAKLGTRFAIKVLWGELLGDRSMTERFLREARMASALVCPHIVRVHDVGEIRPGQPYLALELLEGPSLADQLYRRGALAPSSVALLGAQLAEGIAVAHASSIVHRDLKPDNVLLVRAADRDVAKIVDFGLAKPTGGAGPEARLTATGTIFGTPLYMAPEQVRGEEVGTAADLYALGMLLYESATGAHPWVGQTPMQVLFKHLNDPPVRVPIEGALGDLIMQLLAKDPAERVRAAGDLPRRFAPLADGAKRFVPRSVAERKPPAAADRPIPETLADPRSPPAG